MNCVTCGKPLSDPISIIANKGPICRMKCKQEEQRDYLLFGNPLYHYGWHDAVLVIFDDSNKGAYTSVTNAVEKVLQQIIKKEKYLGNCTIIYKDSTGIYDGIAHKNGIFSHFYSINEVDLYAALKKVKKGK